VEEITMRRLISTAVSLFILTGFMVSANASTVLLEANMDCSQADAGAGTCGGGGSGIGFADIIFDDVSKLLNWNVSWSGLSAPAFAAHFHGPALPNQGGGIQVGIGVGSNPAIGSAILTASQESDMLAGLWYVNVHSNDFLGGEIRGQVNVVPIPAAVWLFGSALAGLGWMRRRQTA
jgi:hypothetical protein